ASAASRSKVPGNTPNRENSACPAGDSSPKLQSRVFLSVRCRSGRSRAPPVIEPGEQRLRRQQSAPSGGQLDGERQAVQPAADLRDRLGVLAGQLETR